MRAFPYLLRVQTKPTFHREHVRNTLGPDTGQVLIPFIGDDSLKCDIAAFDDNVNGWHRLLPVAIQAR